MRLEEIKERLENSGLPVVYRAWPEKKAPPLPFLCYLVDGSDNFFADGKVYEAITRVRVELYSRYKDLGAESAVEAALSGIGWEKTETYIDSEKCYQINYEIEV